MATKMTDRPDPVVRTVEERELIGRMAVYASQADASEGIPAQWRDFVFAHPELPADAAFYGASPCTDDGRIHYLTGVLRDGSENPVGGERLTLVAGEYAFVEVDDAAELRDTWNWLLKTWLPGSGRVEKKAPEFERFAGIAKNGAPVGRIEIWIPLEPLRG